MLQCLSLLLLSRHASAEVGDSAEQVASSLSGSIAIIIEKILLMFIFLKLSNMLC
jgi:hypothetical protein